MASLVGAGERRRWVQGANGGRAGLGSRAVAEVFTSGQARGLGPAAKRSCSPLEWTKSVSLTTN